jgi:hypothetical protein
MMPRAVFAQPGEQSINDTLPTILEQLQVEVEHLIELRVVVDICR